MHKNEFGWHNVARARMVPGSTHRAGMGDAARGRPMTRQKNQKRSAEAAENRIYEMQVRICKALANSNRLRILDLLGKKTYTVSGLQKEMGIPLANVSLQLGTLRAAGVVVTEKRGKQVYCSLALPEVRQACHFIRRVLKAQVRNTQNLPL
jgi:DNA-binding transcriptional ArsR family regulator